MGKYTKVTKMNPKRYVEVGHMGDMWFSAQRSRGDDSNKNRIYIREVFYNKEKCIKAVDYFNKNIINEK